MGVLFGQQNETELLLTFSVEKLKVNEVNLELFRQNILILAIESSL